MELTLGRRISGLVVGGRELHAPVFNENEVRAAAGLVMVIGAVAFALALHKIFLPLQLVTIFFFIEFVTRVTVGLEYSPLGVVSKFLVSRQRPHWVSAKPKRFAWSIGVCLSGAMVYVTNTGIRGALPATLCSICLLLTWLESVLGLCVGCELYAFLMRRGWIKRDKDIELCAGGVCELPVRPDLAKAAGVTPPETTPAPAVKAVSAIAKE